MIVTEVDGRYLVIGPYKNDEAARQDVFEVGGDAHIAELVAGTAFFSPPSRRVKGGGITGEVRAVNEVVLLGPI